MTELKEKAAPKFVELTKEIQNLAREQVITNNLLCQLCNLKEAQQKSDNDKHEIWRKQKNQSTKLSLIAIFLAVAALCLTLMQVDKDGALRDNIINGFNILKGLTL